MFYARLILILCLCITIFGFSSASQGADWKMFYQIGEEGPKGEEDLKYFFDKESIVKPLKGLIQVWFKTTLENDNSNETELYRTHIEINCKSKSYRVLEETKSDNVAAEDKNHKPSSAKAFRRVPLDSAMGTLWSNLCE